MRTSREWSHQDERFKIINGTLKIFGELPDCGPDTASWWFDRHQDPLIHRVLELEREVEALRTAERDRQIELLEGIRAEAKSLWEGLASNLTEEEYLDLVILDKLAELRAEGGGADAKP